PMVQLESWQALQQAERFLGVEPVAGVFVGLGALFLSSGRRAADPETRDMVKAVAAAAQEAGKASGIAAASVEEAREYLAFGYSLVMVSNDATLFGKAVQAICGKVRA